MSDEAIRVAVPRGWALKPVNHTLVCVVRQWMHVGCMDYKQSEKSIAKSSSQKSSNIIIVIITPPPTAEPSIVMSVSICLSVRDHISGTTCLTFTKFCGHVTYGRGSVLLWRRSDTLCTSGFTDNVMFAHKPRLLGVAAQLKRSAHAASGLAINCAQ